MKLVSLNIERSKHLALVLPFLEHEQADAVCLLEVMAYDVPQLEVVLGPVSIFTPTTIHEAESRPAPFGQAIFSRLEITQAKEVFYWGGKQQLPTLDFSTAETKHTTEYHAVSYVDVTSGDESFRIAATHFTWTPHGEADDLQRKDLAAMLHVLEGMGEFVLTGDFNAPRGGEIFSALAEKYKDNIPSEYQSSLDLTLHRAAPLNLMVDGLFTTPAYSASSVRLQLGLSDHAAVIATIARAKTVG